MATPKKVELQSGEVRWVIQVFKKGYKRHNIRKKTKAAAVNEARRVALAMDDGTWDEFAVEAQKKGDTTLKSFFTRYLTEVSPKKAGGQQTIDYETSVLNEISRYSIATIDIYKIRPQHIEKLIGSIKNREDKKKRDAEAKKLAPIAVKPTKVKKKAPEKLTVADTTVNRKLTVLQGLFTHLPKWGHNLDNPISGSHIKDADTERHRELQPYEVEAVQSALSECKSPYVRWLFDICLETGARRREVYENTWGNVDLKKQLLFIPAPIAKIRKSRKIPISPTALSIFKEMKKLQQPRSTDTLFPITLRAFVQSWQRAIKRSGVKDVQFKDSRHVALTNLSKIYPRCQSLARISGHRKLDTLLRYYDETDAERVEQMNAFHKNKAR